MALLRALDAAAISQLGALHALLGALDADAIAQLRVLHALLGGSMPLP